MGFYEECDIVATESKGLSALEWRVCITSTTPIECVMHYVELLLPKFVDISHLILENAAERTDIALSDVYFSTLRASSVGIACLAGALYDMRSMSSLDKEAIWKELSNKLDWDINSEEIGQVVRRITRDHRPASSGYRREQARLRPALTQLVSSLHTQAAWCKWRDKKNSANLYRSMCKSVERSIPIHPGALVAPFVTSSTDADAVGKGVPNSRLGRNDDARGFRHNK